jgi:polar amino acid transport system substrate-binding protein
MKLFKILLIISMFANIAFAKQEKISIVADVWCPFNCDPNTDRQGYMIDIAKIVFAKHNIDIEYKVMPWARALSETESGKYNAVVGASKSDAPKFIFPQNELGRQVLMLYVKEGNDWQIDNNLTTDQALKDIKLGVIIDYSYGKNLDDYIEANKNNKALIELSSGDNALELNIKKLNIGRIDALLEAESVLDYFILEAKDKNYKLKKAGEFKNNLEKDWNNLFIAFSPKNPNSARYAKILSDGVEDLRKSGELEKILAKYGLKDWK